MPPTRDVLHRDGDGLSLPNQHDQPLATRHAGIEQVPLQHGVMLNEHGNDRGRVLHTLTLVDGDRIGGTRVSSSPKP